MGDSPGETRLTRILLIAALAVAGVYVYFAFVRFFMLDDFPLLIQGERLSSLLETVGGRLKPVARLHFFLFGRMAVSPIGFNLLSLGLHGVAASTLYFALREIYDIRVAGIAALLFFIQFSLNEAVYWISAVPIIYCLIFCALTVYLAEKGRWRMGLIPLVLASLSYELWLVLPVYFTLRKNVRLAISGYVLVAVHSLAAWHIGFSTVGYGGLASPGEWPLRIVFYLYRSLLPFYSLPGAVPAAALLACLVAALVIFFRKGYRWTIFPFVWYMVPTFIFLFSSNIPSRFFYFPAAAIAVGAALLVRLRYPHRVIGYVVIGYLVLLSLPIQVLDGMDYRDFSQEGRRLIQQGSAASELKAGDRILVVNRVNQSFPRVYTHRIRGRPKLFFERKRGLGGLIYARDLVDFTLRPRGIHARPHNDCRDALRLEIGQGPVVSSHCFLLFSHD